MLDFAKLIQLVGCGAAPRSVLIDAMGVDLEKEEMAITSSGEQQGRLRFDSSMIKVHLVSFVGDKIEASYFHEEVTQIIYESLAVILDTLNEASAHQVLLDKKCMEHVSDKLRDRTGTKMVITHFESFMEPHNFEKTYGFVVKILEPNFVPKKPGEKLVDLLNEMFSPKADEHNELTPEHVDASELPVGPVGYTGTTCFGGVFGGFKPPSIRKNYFVESDPWMRKL